MWFVFRALPEKRTTFPLSRERSERENQQFRFYVWFQIWYYKSNKKA
ncbi:MAG: hypothetical protein U5L45_17890 [Saprospiraceae bacterium]|nr:hypothetical protein [Saprospiraceae bacterium]